MPLIEGPEGPIETLVTGSGSPVTVFAHGLAGSMSETRPFGSGVRGTRVFFHFRGHGATIGSEAEWSYRAAAAELAAVASAQGARRGLGISLGAGALMVAAVSDPDAFERLVLVLPATIDQPRTDAVVDLMRARAELVEHRDVEGLAASLVREQPAGVRTRPDVRLWAGRQAQRLTSTTVARALRELPPQHPLSARTELAAIRCPVLVVGQEGDLAHPAATARELAGLLPAADLEIYDDRGLMWTHRAAVRRRIATFLNS